MKLASPRPLLLSPNELEAARSAQRSSLRLQRLRQVREQEARACASTRLAFEQAARARRGALHARAHAEWASSLSARRGETVGELLLCSSLLGEAHTAACSSSLLLRREAEGSLHRWEQAEGRARLRASGAASELREGGERRRQQQQQRMELRRLVAQQEGERAGRVVARQREAEEACARGALEESATAAAAAAAAGPSSAAVSRVRVDFTHTRMHDSTAGGGRRMLAQWTEASVERHVPRRLSRDGKPCGFDWQGGRSGDAVGQASPSAAALARVEEERGEERRRAQLRCDELMRQNAAARGKEALAHVRLKQATASLSAELKRVEGSERAYKSERAQRVRAGSEQPRHAARCAGERREASREAAFEAAFAPGNTPLDAEAEHRALALRALQGGGEGAEEGGWTEEMRQGEEIEPRRVAPCASCAAPSLAGFPSQTPRQSKTGVKDVREVYVPASPAGVAAEAAELRWGATARPLSAWEEETAPPTRQPSVRQINHCPPHGHASHEAGHSTNRDIAASLLATATTAAQPRGRGLGPTPAVHSMGVSTERRRLSSPLDQPLDIIPRSDIVPTGSDTCCADGGAPSMHDHNPRSPMSKRSSSAGRGAAKHGEGDSDEDWGSMHHAQKVCAHRRQENAPHPSAAPPLGPKPPQAGEAPIARLHSVTPHPALLFDSTHSSSDGMWRQSPPPTCMQREQVDGPPTPMSSVYTSLSSEMGGGCMWGEIGDTRGREAHLSPASSDDPLQPTESSTSSFAGRWADATFSGAGVDGASALTAGVRYGDIHLSAAAPLLASSLSCPSLPSSDDDLLGSHTFAFNSSLSQQDSNYVGKHFSATTDARADGSTAMSVDQE
ncbi:MAG: hypothetical protein SGPRY_012912 [Prymnesium sp.]